jgi:hypothetical protein
MAPLVGYARVSANGQILDAQVEALDAAGADVIFEEIASRGTRTGRPQLAKAIDALRRDDAARSPHLLDAGPTSTRSMRLPKGAPHSIESMRAAQCSQLVER